MKKHLPLTGLAATLCLLLSGCAPLERIDKIDNKVSQDEKQADKHLNALKKGSVVRDLTSQWINPYPLNTQPGGNSLLPPCAVAINRPGSITLAEVSAFISKRCRLPVVVTPDAQAILAPTGGKTEQLSGPVPAPDPNGMVPLAALGGSPARAAPAVTGGTSLRGVFWQGSWAVCSTMSPLAWDCHGVMSKAVSPFSISTPGRSRSCLWTVRRALAQKP